MPFPNPDTQFKPGQSGNLKGHPKGRKNLSTHIQDLLNDESFTADVVEGYVVKKSQGAPVKAIVRVAAIKALAGDTKWAEWLGKYGYGSKQEVDLTSNGETVAQPIDMDMVTQFMMMAKDQTKQ